MKTAIVTGGNSGIGYATAKLLKENNYDVTITGRSRSRVEQAAKELRVKGVVADMSNLQQLRELSANFEEGLDVLVLNAAIAKFSPLALSDIDQFNDMLDTNVRGPFFLCQYLEDSLAKKQGAISFISSAVVNNGLSNASLYAISKGSLDSLCKSLAVELAPKGVRVNVVSPGAIDTPIIHKLGIPEDLIPSLKKQIEATIPMNRYGQPTEIAKVIISQLEASYVTGAIWSVDGGVNAV
jgi:NAD(P)-dependent dehydrogenase (short-subunit alcohol dehydrogenase family)